MVHKGKGQTVSRANSSVAANDCAATANAIAPMSVDRRALRTKLPPRPFATDDPAA